MSIRLVRALSLVLILTASVAALALTVPAGAQGPTPNGDDSCYTCHEQLYRLHDIGQAFCLCGAPMECTCCHGGVAGELEEEAAHAGMVANPLQEQAPPCQNCHPDDADERRAIFAAHAGVSGTPCPTVEAIIEAIVPPVAPPEPSRLEAWQIAVLAPSAWLSPPWPSSPIAAGRQIVSAGGLSPRMQEPSTDNRREA